MISLETQYFIATFVGLMFIPAGIISAVYLICLVTGHDFKKLVERFAGDE